MSHSRVSGMRKRATPGAVAAKTVSVPALVKKSSKSRSFYFRYLELCRAKGHTPVPEIRKNSDEITTLELYVDKLNVSDWLLINEALHNDLCLNSLVLRMRRSYQHNTIDPIDTENRARLFTQRPVVFTRFIFRGLVQSIASCVESNTNLRVLQLEGLPLCDGYIDCIAKSLAAKIGLETLSFRRSRIGDKGCELVCKYLKGIAQFDLSECRITAKGAVYVAEMIKRQRLPREQSLRCQTPNDDGSILGLRTLLLGNNPDFGDEGLQCIAEMLKDDACIKVVDMQSCGLTDIGANVILECLQLNSALKEFNVRGNERISELMHRSIRDHLGTPDPAVEGKQETEYDLSCIEGLESLPKGQKFTISQLRANTEELEQRLVVERKLRQRAEEVNIKLTNQLRSIDGQMVTDKEEPSSSQLEEEQPNSSQMKKEQPKSSQMEEEQPNSSQMKEEQPNSSQMEEEQLNLSQIEEEQPNSSQMEEKHDSLSEVKSDMKATDTSHSPHMPNEHPEMIEKDYKESPTNRESATSKQASPEMSPRCDLSTLCDDEDSDTSDSQFEWDPVELSRFWEKQKATRVEILKVRSEKPESNKNHEEKLVQIFPKCRYDFIPVGKVKKDIGDHNQQGRASNELCGDGRNTVTLMIKGGPKQGRGRNG